MSSVNPLFILYGSATGNAEHIAKALAASYEPDDYFDSVVCVELNGWKRHCTTQWEQDSGRKYGVLIVTSTTGNGDAPENAARFVRTMKRAKDKPFRHVVYAVLGLGDTNYDQFCQCGKIIDRKLEELGGTRLKPLACADEATGLEDKVEPWTQTIVAEITAACRGYNHHHEDDEKKMEGSEHEMMSTASTATATTRNGEKRSVVSVSVSLKASPLDANKQPSVGVQIVRSLLQLKQDEPLPTVDVSCLSTLNTSTSAARDMLPQQQRPRGMSDASSITSSGYHYTLQRPFMSTVLQARYLTDTSTHAAQEIVQHKLTHATAFRVLEQHFPLTNTSSAERNGKRVLELTLSLPDDYTLEYAPGDSLGLEVENSNEAVQFVLEVLQRQQGVNLDGPIGLDGQPPSLTVREAVRKHMDLCSPVNKNRRVLYALAQYACGDDATALLLLASKSPQGCHLLEGYIEQQRLTVVDILREFPSCQSITLEALLSILPTIPPRYYSVSSSPIVDRHSLTIAFSVVDYLTPSLIVDGVEHGQRRIGGLATRYMEALCAHQLVCSPAPSSSTLPIFPKPTIDFRMPNSLSTPLILIGPGTGVAPFMGFLLHRRALLSSSESTEAALTVVEGTWRGGYEIEDELPVSKNDASGLRVGVDFRTSEDVGSVDLFFGCRHRNHDWLYREEMQSLQAEGIIANLHVAVSRDDENGHRRYVQDSMRECAERLTMLILKQNACVYVCGDGNAMAKDVQGVVVELLASSLGDMDAAVSYFECMKVERRFLMDIWS